MRECRLVVRCLPVCSDSNFCLWAQYLIVTCAVMLQLAEAFPFGLPHVACAVLRHGSLLPTLTALLQTDCLEEVCFRQLLYASAMNLLQRLGRPLLPIT